MVSLPLKSPVMTWPRERGGKVAVMGCTNFTSASCFTVFSCATLHSRDLLCLFNFVCNAHNLMLPSLLHVHACGLLLIQEKKQEKQRKEERGREKKRKCRSYLSCAWDSGDTVDPRRACGLNHLLQCLQENNSVRKESILSKADEKEKIKNYKNKEERRYLSFDDDDVRTNGHPHMLEHDTHRLHHRRVGASNHLKPTILLHCLNDILIWWRSIRGRGRCERSIKKRSLERRSRIQD